MSLIQHRGLKKPTSNLGKQTIPSLSSTKSANSRKNKIKESRERYKYLKLVVEKAIRRNHCAFIKEKCDQCESALKKGDSHFMYRLVWELANKTDIKACSLVDEDGNEIESTGGIPSRCKTILKIN